MTNMLQFFNNSNHRLGVLDGDVIQACVGDLFKQPRPVDEWYNIKDVEILIPCKPGKMLALWNNFHSRAEHEGWDIPAEPLYFVKTPNSFNAHGKPIVRPSSYHGPIFFEGELGVVIGKTTADISESDAAYHIFGYTCINDVTAKEILNRDPSFQQWTRAKGFDSFGAFGPVIATDVDVDSLVIQSRLDGELLQEYPVTDMIFHPHKLVSLISQDMTLYPGDIIACGTGLNARAMDDGQVIEISINGIGTLTNTMISAS
ncbi:MAG: fumarylacetoacetate hydrolase family protein [Gammaproteobacteria bacterium]|nr:fumarylacetoacetate hydrolase family protein [Gammaproteobacteria bacterium]NNJ97148.1 fumarylacetoacetate hydrolase family protein [Gammaproteobacteria bacterium]